jgi:predicted amidohydrolase YtcJ
MRRRWLRPGPLLLMLAASLTLASMTARAAATLIEHVHGYTLAGTRLVRFGALVFENGRVVSTGEAAALRRAYPKARVLDGAGRTLLPGLIDAHGHVRELGFTFVRIQLYETKTLAQAQARIRAFVAAHPAHGWYRGDGWNQVIWQLGRFPTAAELDAAVADSPAALGRVDGHALWLNTAALRAAGITRDTPDPLGGRIEHDANGDPDGVLVDKAMDLVARFVQPADDAERPEAVKAALAHLNSVGLSSVGDAGVDAAGIALYRALADRGELPVRVYAMILDAGEDFRTVSRDGPLIGYAQDRLTVRAVKLFADGALGSRGAALLEPYSDAPGQRGLLRMSDAEMERRIETGLRAGYQVNVHAIGDAAVRQVLDGFEAAYRAVGGRELRNRIEHSQVVSPQDMPRYVTLNLIASMQPTHATSDKNMALDRIGPERLKGAYAWRSFLDQGTRIAGGSDFPIESDNPFYGLHAAVTRTDHMGQPAGGWHPEQAMTLLEAFRAFTLDAAYAQHQEQQVGSLEPGKWADFILVDRDLFRIPAADIWKIRVEQTWVAGRRVY